MSGASPSNYPYSIFTLRLEFSIDNLHANDALLSTTPPYFFSHPTPLHIRPPPSNIPIQLFIFGYRKTSPSPIFLSSTANVPDNTRNPNPSPTYSHPTSLTIHFPADPPFTRPISPTIIHHLPSNTPSNALFVHFILYFAVFVHTHLCSFCNCLTILFSSHSYLHSFSKLAATSPATTCYPLPPPSFIPPSCFLSVLIVNSHLLEVHYIRFCVPVTVPFLAVANHCANHSPA